MSMTYLHRFFYIRDWLEIDDFELDFVNDFIF